MASNSDVLREFLVQLGFKIDRPTEQRFVDHVKRTTLAVAGLGTGAVVAAAAVVGATAKMAKGLEGLYFTSQRTKASAKNILSFGYAAERMGGSVEGMTGAIEALKKFERSQPHGRSWIEQSLGVDLRNAHGGALDTADQLQRIGKALAAMHNQPRAMQYAGILGIPYRELLVLERGISAKERVAKTIFKAMGYHPDAAAKASHAFMNQWSKLKLMGDALKGEVTEDLSKAIGPELKKLVTWIESHRKTIVGWMDSAGAAIVKFGKEFGHLVSVIWNGYEDMSPSFKRMLKWILGISAALMLVNAEPVLSLGAAFVWLWNDYEKWKKGGKSVIDWKRWQPEIAWAKKSIKELIHWITTIDWSHVRNNVVTMVKDFEGLADAIWSVVHAFEAVGHFLKVGGKYPWTTEGGKAYERWGIRVLAWQQKFVGERHTAAERMVYGVHAPRGLRNNNPGNIMYGSFARARGAIGQDAGGFAKFPHLRDGLRAMSANLVGYARDGIHTIAGVISRWAPHKNAQGKVINNTRAYIAAVARAMGISANANINLMDPGVRAALERAIALHENGGAALAIPAWKYAMNSGVPGNYPGQVHITQNVTNHITSPSDPGSIGKAVGSATASANERLVRNTKRTLQ